MSLVSLSALTAVSLVLCGEKKPMIYVIDMISMIVVAYILFLFRVMRLVSLSALTLVPPVLCGEKDL
jgi:hypothetical protein